MSTKSKATPDVLPCPFCGAEPKFCSDNQSVFCPTNDCVMRGAVAYWKGWNTRPASASKSEAESGCVPAHGATMERRGAAMSSLFRIKLKVKPHNLRERVHEIVAEIDPNQDVLDQLCRLPKYGSSPMEELMGVHGYTGRNTIMWARVLKIVAEPSAAAVRPD